LSTDFGLPRRVAIVTGAARGLGAATAELFARFGAHVVACDIDGEALEESVSGLEGESHVAIACDLSRPGNCESLVAETLERHNRLDILVNVAGIIERLQLNEIDEADWTRTMDANAKSQFFLCRAAAEPMKRRGEPHEKLRPLARAAHHHRQRDRTGTRRYTHGKRQHG